MGVNKIYVRGILVKIISKDIKRANMSIYKLFAFKNWDSGVYVEEAK